MAASASMMALDRAIEFMHGQGELARALKKRTQAISYWKRTGRVPVEPAMKIHRITDGRVPFASLCPEIAALVLESLDQNQMDLFIAKPVARKPQRRAHAEQAMT